MRVLFDPLARDEMNDAAAWYEAQREGLGAEFRRALRDAIQRTQRHPLACAVVKDDVRRILLPRFPYKVLFSIEADHLYVLAVTHNHRAPDYWVARMSNP